MLKNAWYLTHADFYDGLTDTPRLPQAIDLPTCRAYRKATALS